MGAWLLCNAVIVRNNVCGQLLLTVTVKVQAAKFRHEINNGICTRELKCTLFLHDLPGKILAEVQESLARISHKHGVKDLPQEKEVNTSRIWIKSAKISGLGMHLNPTAVESQCNVSLRMCSDA